MHRFWIIWAEIIKFLAVAEVEEDDSGASMLPPSVIFEICPFSVSSDMKCIFRVGNRWTVLFLGQDSDLFQGNTEENKGKL